MMNGSKRSIGGVVASKRSNLPLRVSNQEDGKKQFCNRLGCSMGPKSMTNSQHSTPNGRIKNMKSSSSFTNEKPLFGMSSSPLSSRKIKKSQREKQKEPLPEMNQAENSSVDDGTESSVSTPSDGVSNLSHSELDGSISAQNHLSRMNHSAETLKTQQKTYRQSSLGSREVSHSSISGHSSLHGSIRQTTKTVSQGKGSSVRNLSCTPVSDAFATRGSSSNSRGNKMNTIKNGCGYLESSSVRVGRRTSVTVTGQNSESQRNHLLRSNPSCSLTSSSQPGLGARNWDSMRNRIVASTWGTTSVNHQTGWSKHDATRSTKASKTIMRSGSLPPLKECSSSGSSLSNTSQSSLGDLSTPSNVHERLGNNNRILTESTNISSIDPWGRSRLNASLNQDRYRSINMEGIAETLSVLEIIERDEELTYEQMLAFETNLVLGELGFRDQHRDMRLDIDNMSYEELLALEERMGNVSTALSEEALSECLTRSQYPLNALGTESLHGDNDFKCSICQEEYVKGEELGMLWCEHLYHVPCIHQWLRLKNWCPICKASAAKPSSA